MSSSREQVIGIGIAFAVLPTVCVALRFWSRKLAKIPFGAEDWLVLPALVGHVLCQP